MSAVSYRRLVVLYTLVPITALATLVAFTLQLCFIWPAARSPSPLLDVTVLAAAWAAAHGARAPIFSASSLCGRFANAWTLGLATIVHTATEELARLGALLLLRLQLADFREGASADDPSFARAWWAALGWAALEVAVGIAQGYEQLALYRDVLPGGTRHSAYFHHHQLLSERTPLTSRTPLQTYGASPMMNSSLNGSVDYLDDELTHLIEIKSRAELEDVFGVPIPVRIRSVCVESVKLLAEHSHFHLRLAAH